jgi:hypothetical protein
MEDIDVDLWIPCSVIPTGLINAVLIDVRK